MFSLLSTGMNMKIEKGSQFLFFKLLAESIELNDVTNYPKTNTTPHTIG